MTNHPSRLLEQNRQWARERVTQDPGYFSRLVGQQAPEFLWIGCSDSRVPANVITGLDPGEVFVHRNVANLVYAADINCMSVLQFAVERLRVRHVIVCGHYGCGGVRAALASEELGLIDHWLEPIRDIARLHTTELDGQSDAEARLDRLCEMNVLGQVQNLINSPIMKRAWDRGYEVAVHGWIYGVHNGLLRDLGCSAGPGAGG